MPSDLCIINQRFRHKCPEPALESMAGRSDAWPAAGDDIAMLIEDLPGRRMTLGRSSLADYRFGRDQRHDARLRRRMERKDRRGQPQRISDIRRAERKGMYPHVR